MKCNSTVFSKDHLNPLFLTMAHSRCHCHALQLDGQSLNHSLHTFEAFGRKTIYRSMALENVNRHGKTSFEFKGLSCTSRIKQNLGDRS